MKPSPTMHSATATGTTSSAKSSLSGTPRVKKITLSLEEVKQLQLEMLSTVHEFCQDNGLRYFLIGGTLLGAIRHKGYIPWDDDIDIAMPRPDYEKFLQTFQHDRFYAKDYLLDKKWPECYAKVMARDTLQSNPSFLYKGNGVWIDIFPLDGCPSTKMSLWWHRHLHLVIGYLRFHKRRPLGMYLHDETHWARKHLPYKLLSYLVPLRWLMALEYWLLHHLDYEGAKRIVYWGASPAVLDKSFSKEAFASVVPVTFEQYTLFSPVGWDEFLRIRYGDYMTLPPIEERVLQHLHGAWKLVAEGSPAHQGTGIQGHGT